MSERDWRCEDPKQQLIWAAATSETLRACFHNMKML